jgi:hypothetical protein
VKKILDTKYKMTILNEGRGFNIEMRYIENNYKKPKEVKNNKQEGENKLSTL